MIYIYKESSVKLNFFDLKIEEIESDITTFLEALRLQTYQQVSVTTALTRAATEPAVKRRQVFRRLMEGLAIRHSLSTKLKPTDKLQT
jgi:hypothetical protein